ncbi:hypothetical protein ACOSQ2_010269 [Xanthoceras sorbifolium]
MPAILGKDLKVDSITPPTLNIDTNPAKKKSMPHYGKSLNGKICTNFDSSLSSQFTKMEEEGVLVTAGNKTVSNSNDMDPVSDRQLGPKGQVDTEAHVSNKATEHGIFVFMEQGGKVKKTSGKRRARGSNDVQYMEMEDQQTRKIRGQDETVNSDVTKK